MPAIAENRRTPTSCSQSNDQLKAGSEDGSNGGASAGGGGIGARGGCGSRDGCGARGRSRLRAAAAEEAAAATARTGGAAATGGAGGGEGGGAGGGVSRICGAGACGSRHDGTAPDLRRLSCAAGLASGATPSRRRRFS